MEMIKSISIENLVQKRNASIERVEKIFSAIDEIKGLGFSVGVYGPHSSGMSAKSMTRDIDSQAWALLMEESGLKAFMDAERKRKWNEALEKNDIPELTVENIESTFRNLYEQRIDMMEDGVIGIYRKLRWCYKSNRPIKFGKKVIINYAIDYGYVGHRTTETLEDLERVFLIADGKPERDNRNNLYIRLNELGFPKKNKEVDLGYFTVKGFKNGNIHVIFSNLELVDKLNLILAKRYPDALPPKEDE